MLPLPLGRSQGEGLANAALANLKNLPLKLNEKACVFVLCFQSLPLFFVWQGWESLVLPHLNNPDRVGDFLHWLSFLNALEATTMKTERALHEVQRLAGDGCTLLKLK